MEKGMIERFQQKTWAMLLLCFAVFFLYFFYLQAHDGFADPDAFYHAKITSLLLERGWRMDFSWLPYTTLSHAFADQHLLFHFFLIPFVTLIPDPLIGMKVSAILFSTLACVAMIGFLHRFGVPWKGAIAAVALAALTNPLAFRWSLGKAPVVAFLWMVIGLWLAFARRPILLGAWSFLFAWIYGGFPMLPIGVFFFVIFDTAEKMGQIRHPAMSFFKRLRQAHRANRGIGFIGASTGGVVLGALLHPHLPNYLPFWWMQMVEIGLKNYKDVIGVGGEWYAYAPADLVNNTILISAALLGSFYVLLTRARDQDAKTWTLFALMMGSLILTLKSRRYVEFYVPFAALYLGFAFRPLVRTWTFHHLQSLFWKTMERRTWWWIPLALYFLVMFPAIASRDVWITRQQLDSGNTLTSLKAAAAWMVGHIPANEIIVHSDWDEFPVLFYWDDLHRYIAGLDATFFYKQDPERYWAWVKLTTGETDSGLATVVGETLDSRWVFATNDHTGMISHLKADAAFEQVYHDEEATIFHLNANER